MIFPDLLIKGTLVKRYKRFLADVELEDGEVVLECNSGANGNLHISVSDTGPGIPDDMRDKVFEPFDRLGAESSNIPGTGIGLTVTRQLIESMSGEIGFESTVGEGTTF